jgi:energy-coupling factor transporter ATP-binding protein EcfA2
MLDTVRSDGIRQRTVSSEAVRAQQPQAPSPTDYTIEIKDCNSIAEAHISLRRSSLNIKYGPNGVGKSTIARALVLNSQGSGALQELLPFKYRQRADQPSPSVTGDDDINRVLIFDDMYVSQFVFQPDEVVKDSFEIFINTPEYQEGIERIESIFGQLKRVFLENSALDDVIDSFTELHNAFTVTKSGAIAKTSRGFKALGVSGKLISIPKSLRGYEKFLRGDDPAGWITWQSKGRAYLEMSDNCPFCSVPNVDKETAQRVSKEYESAAVKNMSALRHVIERLRSSFAPGHLEQLRKITTTIGGLSPEQSQFLAGMRGQIETLLNKFTALKGLSFHALRDVVDIDEVLRGLKIDLTLLDALDSEATRTIVASMNDKLEDIAGQINEIKAHVGVQKTRVARLIRENQDEINEFLESAGYQYSVRIEPSADSYHMILEHNDAPGHLEAASRHLSYGERNAFALVLFMHHVRRDSPDLVVLDDPVSSFDKTKKFAILHKLFHGKNSIRDFTTLLLTHDIEPAIDVVLTATSGQFQASEPIAYFLRSQNGRVEEKQIQRADIMTFSQVCAANIASSADDIIKCIYLRRRYEVYGDTGAEYDVISSLLHLREDPDRNDGDGTRVPLSAAEVKLATESIRRWINGFDYDAILSQLRDPAVLKSKFEETHVGYEKVQLFRIASELNSIALGSNAAFRKFVNETYHIENEYVMQLNPREFDAVPEHVIDLCAALLESGVQMT